MKSALFIASCLLAAVVKASPTARDSTGLPGDNFSLQGALDLFKRSRDLESFEKALNAQNNKVNNLDLNGDGNIDYIRVVDHSGGAAHAIALQIPVNKGESQDVAVIELEKKGEASAAVQIRGDQDLYGKEVIIQPKAKEERSGSPKNERGPWAPAAPQVLLFVNVWSWPCVEWMYGPEYVVWVSPFYWDYYPPWWHPWHPFPWHTWWGWQTGYYYDQWYEPTTIVYVEHAHAIYAPRRVHSPYVVQHIRRSRTIVAPRPKSTAVPTMKGRPDERKPSREQPVQRPMPRRAPERIAPPRREAPAPPHSPQRQPHRMPRPR